MLFNDYKKSYIEFCDEEILREILLAKRRYLRVERRAVNQCVLNATDEYGNEYVDVLENGKDITEDNDLKFVDKIENEKLFKSVKLLSDREQEVVSLRIDKDMPVKEINIVLGTKREKTASDVYVRSLKKLRKEMENDSNE